MTVTRDAGVVRAVIDHPPMNLMDSAMIADLDTLGLALVSDEQAKVLLLESANPDFFIAHADLMMFGSRF